MATVPMVSNVDPATDPHAIIFFDVIQKSLERHKPSGAAQKSTVHPNRHHLRSLLPFGVQHIKRIPQISKKMFSRVEPLWRGEPQVIRVQGVGYNQVRPHFAARRRDFRPEWQVIPVIISVIQKTAMLDNKAASIRAIPSGIPTPRRLTGQTLDNFTGHSHVLSLSLFVDLLVVDPPPAVGSNFVP